MSVLQPARVRPAAQPDRGRLEFIDGLRGVAAVVVMVGHMARMVPPGIPSVDLFHADLQRRLLWPFLFGHPMMWLFFLISGFSLYRAEENRVRRGLGRTSVGVYARCRAWRILPTYLVALTVGLVVSGPLGWLLSDPSPGMRPVPVTPGGVLAHLALVHNLRHAWMSQANAPLWSIAAEAQLYALLPVLLTAVSRRVPVPVAAATLAAGLLLLQRIAGLPLGYLAVWFFTGAALAHLTRRRRLPRRSLLVAAAGFLLFGLTRPFDDVTAACQAIWLAGFGCLVSGLLGAPSGGWNVVTLPAPVWLGQRSYSLYAMHFPVALLAWSAVSRAGLSGGPAVVAVIITGVPASIAAATVVYRWVERPSLLRSVQSRQQSADGARGRSTGRRSGVRQRR